VLVASGHQQDPEYQYKEDFVKKTAGMEQYEFETRDARRFKGCPLQGPSWDEVVWRETRGSSTGAVLESRSVKGVDTEELFKEIPDGPKTIKTTFWYEKQETPQLQRPKHVRKMTPKARHSMMAQVWQVTAVLLMEALTYSTIASQWGGAWMQKMYGTARPDVWEIFGGHAEISMQAWRAGWMALQPIDAVYGDDLKDKNQRKHVLETIRKTQPRLVIVEFPCTYWSNLTHLNFRSQERRRMLKKLQASEMIFLELAEQIARLQMANGDDFLLENPLCSAARKQSPIRRLEQDPETYIAISHMCRFGLRHPQNGRPLKKPTWWLTSAPEIAYALNKSCCCTPDAHGVCMGGYGDKACSSIHTPVGQGGA